jgi:ActR/RegA family two-component response regulator
MMEAHMDTANRNLRLLLVDDDDDFRRAAGRTLQRRGFSVTEVANGTDALESLRGERPDIVVLDLRMPGLSGIETLQRMREIEPEVPVIILTGHGDFESAVASIKLSIVDFLQKPADVDELAGRIRSLLERGGAKPLDEPTVAELMVPPSGYPRLYLDEPVTKALSALRDAFFKPVMEGGVPGQVRSALVYNRNEEFVGLIRFTDLLKLVLPPFLETSEYTSYFTGMFLAQCKVVANRSLSDIVESKVTVDARAPIMEAVHLMAKHHLVNLPVTRERRLAGILRERDIILQIARLSGGGH